MRLGQEKGDPFLVILGTGRSGTTYIHKVLNEGGLDFLHEDIGKNGGIGFNLLWYIKHHHVCVKDVKVLHVIREPLRCISSLLTFTDCHWRKFQRRTYELQYTYDDPIKRGMEYYLHWNKLCYETSHCTFRLEEDLYKNYLSKYCRLDFEWNNYPSNVNTRNHKDLSWDDLYKKDEKLTKTIKDFYTTLPIVGAP